MQLKKCEALLRDGLNTLNIALTDHQIHQLMNYLTSLHKWNKAYNLSAIKNPEEMVAKHLLDSLALVPYLSKKLNEKKHASLLDVGTGAGLPGLVLAIVFPNLQVTLLDSNGKKTRFLFQVKTELSLNNVTIEHSRIEQLTPNSPFDVITSRAFASIDDFVSGAAHCLDAEGEYWAMKGQYPQVELDACHSVDLKESYSLTIPHCEGERHLLVLAPQ